MRFESLLISAASVSLVALNSAQAYGRLGMELFFIMFTIRHWCTSNGYVGYLQLTL